MEKNQYPEPRDMRYEKPSKGLVWSFFAVVLVIIAAVALLFIYKDEVRSYLSPEKECVAPDTAIAVAPVPTIQEILQFRKDTKEGIRIDSIFLSMPDVVLIDILMTHGTSLSNSDIVYIYESNKTTYKDVLRGAEIQKKMPRDSLFEDSLKCKRRL